MIETIIKEVFHTNEYTLEKTNKGLTNHNYLLKVKGKEYMMRIPREDSGHIVNRKHEKIVTLLAKELDVEMIYFNEVNGVKITVNHPDVYEYDECPYVDKIERCAIMMKKLHALCTVPFCFNPFDTLHVYRSHVNEPMFDLNKYEPMIEQIKHFNNTNVLCHNDWVHGNILLSEQRDYLIDYEYGAGNDPLFDVTSFLSENKIFDNDLRERFYAVYFDEITPKIREQLYLWEMFQNVLWCNWAMMMYESRAEEVYKDIAQDKYNALLRMK